MDCVEDCGYDNLSLSRVMVRVFSLKNTPFNMWVMWVYIVWVETWCIRYDKMAKQNVSRISHGRPYSQNTRENQLSSSVITLCIQVMCRARASLHGKASRELPVKTYCSSLCLESLHSLSHTTLTKKSHIKYSVHKIEQNYNQIWHGIKANTK